MWKLEVTTLLHDKSSGNFERVMRIATTMSLEGAAASQHWNNSEILVVGHEACNAHENSTGNDDSAHFSHVIGH